MVSAVIGGFFISEYLDWRGREKLQKINLHYFITRKDI